MKLTKDQTKVANWLRDRNVPEDIAVFVALHYDPSWGMEDWIVASHAVGFGFLWGHTEQGFDFWNSFEQALLDEVESQ